MSRFMMNNDGNDYFVDRKKKLGKKSLNALLISISFSSDFFTTANQRHESIHSNSMSKKNDLDNLQVVDNICVKICLDCEESIDKKNKSH